MTIKIKLGNRQNDKIVLSITDITDAVEIYNTARAALDGNNVMAAHCLSLVNEGKFEVIE